MRRRGAAWGGRSSASRDVKDNQLSVGGTSTVTDVYGGVSYDASNRIAGKATSNTAVLSDTAAAVNITGGYAATATGNTAAVEGGTVTGTVIGGRAAAGDATENLVDLKAGATLGTSGTPITITGGLSEHGAASNNDIDVMSGTVIHGDLIGGDGTTATNDNTITLENATVHGTIIGGTRASGTGNTLLIDGNGTSTVNKFEKLQSLQFVIPETLTAAQAAANPLLQLTSMTQDITGMKVGVQVAGTASPLQKGDEISLMKVAAGGTITSDAQRDLCGPCVGVRVRRQSKRRIPRRRRAEPKSEGRQRHARARLPVRAQRQPPQLRPEPHGLAGQARGSHGRRSGRLGILRKVYITDIRRGVSGRLFLRAFLLKTRRRLVRADIDWRASNPI